MAVVSRLVTAFISFSAVAAGVESSAHAAACGGSETCLRATAAMSEQEIEQVEAAEIGAMEVRLIQAKREQVALQIAKAKENATAAANATHEESSHVSSSSMDHNGNLCLLCNTPKPERLGGKVYKEFRTDCGSMSSPRGPTKEQLVKPVVDFLETGASGKRATNAYCELNFAKSCVDAVANKDYLYWAKSLDFAEPNMRKNAIFDARYCKLNGFLSKDTVRIASNFTAMQEKARDLCQSKYAKYGIQKLSFMDMMTRARYTDESAPTLEEAEQLAAWNCGMGDLGCDMAGCAYSFCSKGENSYGVYDECEGWHPVHGMPAH